MGNVVRIGDSVACGDHAAEGSANVFCNGMPITHKGKHTTTGHGCFPPTVFISGLSKTVFVNNSLVVLKGAAIQPHRCGKAVHGGAASTSSPDVSIEA
jgi:uncharacterized Zn-binding protein involved in type VI secretion